jgi:hemerythrin-like domain-containing protein
MERLAEHECELSCNLSSWHCTEAAMLPNRRRLLRVAGAGAVGALLGSAPLVFADDKKGEGKEVAAVEDLMREHGLLRRALLVYSEAAVRLLRGRDVSPAELGRTAALFRTFGEDYHARGLEEKHVFAPLNREGGRAAPLVRTLTAQHERGREITDYVIALTGAGKISPAKAAPLSKTLTDFVRMYEHHTAIEDTVVFPAWKAAITPAQYHESSEEFEELEQQMFGRDGFQDSLRRVAAIEEAFGLSDLTALTAAPPPRLPSS